MGSSMKLKRTADGYFGAHFNSMARRSLVAPAKVNLLAIERTALHPFRPKYPVILGCNRGP